MLNVVWFYNPLVLNTYGGQSMLKTVKNIGRQINDLPDGYTFDLFRFFHSSPEIRESINQFPKAQVLFNYMGGNNYNHNHSIFELAAEPSGPQTALEGIRQYPLAVHAKVESDVIRINFVFSRNLSKRSTIEVLARRFERTLIAISECI